MRQTSLKRNLLAVASVLALGCTTVPEKGGFDQVRSETSDRLGQRVHWRQGGEEDRAVDDAVRATLAKPLTADAAVALTLLNNRRLQATYEDLGVSQAALVQAGLLRNPRFAGSFLPALQSGPFPLIGLELAQDFSDLLLLARRQRIAESEFDATKARVTAAVLDKAAQAKQAVLELQTAQALLTEFETLARASELSLEATQKFFEAGNITALSVASAKASHAQAQLAFADARASVSVGREKLSRIMGLWGLDVAAWTVVPGPAALPETEIDLEHVERRAITRSLELVQSRAEVAAAGERAGLAKWSTLLSEIELGVTADREDDGVWHVGPSVSLQVPIFDQGQARNAAAAALLRQALQRYMAQAIETRSAARMARDRLRAARWRVVMIRDSLLPAREQVLAETKLQYNGMQTSLFMLLAARGEQAQANVMLTEALKEYWSARAGLELILAGGAGAESTGESNARLSSTSRHSDKDH